MKNQASKKAVISVNNVSKNFKLPHDRKNSLKQHFVGLFKGKSNYEKFEALKDINFTVNEGDFFGIVGRNGSGKSTLLKIISGIYQPSSGSVKINGTLTPFIELGIGFNPELTGRENVYLNGSILGLTKKEINELYDEIVKFAELERFMDQKLKNYSSGMQVRLAFSIAIRAQNDILLLDEVLAVGDINFQKKCFNYFQKLKSEKKTVIFVTHDMGAVKEYCNKAVLINDSKVVATRDINDVLEKYMDIMNPKDENDAEEESSKKGGIAENYTLSLASKKIEVKDASIKMKFNIKSEKEFDNLKFHLSACIKDNLDMPVLKYNSRVSNQDKGIDMKKGDNWIDMDFYNHLTSGKYLVDFSVLDSEGATIIFLEKCFNFDIENGLNSVSKINSLKNLTVNNKEIK